MVEGASRDHLHRATAEVMSMCEFFKGKEQEKRINDWVLYLFIIFLFIPFSVVLLCFGSWKISRPLILAIFPDSGKTKRQQQKNETVNKVANLSYSSPLS